MTKYSSVQLREGSLPALLLPTLEVGLDGGHEPGGEAVAVRGERHRLEDGRGQDGVAWRQNREVSNIDMHSVTVQICREGKRLLLTAFWCFHI